MIVINFIFIIGTTIIIIDQHLLMCIMYIFFRYLLHIYISYKYIIIIITIVQINTAIEQLFEIELLRQEKVILSSTLGVGMARLGQDDQQVT